MERDRVSVGLYLGWRLSCVVCAVFLLASCATTGGSLDKEKHSALIGEYLERPDHKAYAMNLTNYMSSSVWSRSTQERATSDALNNCREHSGGACELIYAGNDPRHDVTGHYSGSGSDFGAALGQATGLFAAFVGALGGDTNLSNQGLDLFARSSGVPPPGQTPSPQAATNRGSSGGGTPVAGTDPNAVVDRCAKIAEQRFPAQKQNVLLQRAACLYYCVYNITGDRKYFDLYTKSQANANSLCSVSVGNRCNDIRPIQQCNYQ